MRRTWPYLLGCAVLCALAGVVIAGRPSDSGSFVLTPAQLTTTVPETTTTDPVTTLPPPASTSAPSTTAPAESVPSTTARPNSSTPATPTVAPMRAPAQVRVVVVNAAAADGLAATTADLLAKLGYVELVTTTAEQQQDTSLVYYRAGFDREARRLLADLGFEASSTAPLPDVAVSDSDAQGDIIVVVGADRRP